MFYTNKFLLGKQKMKEELNNTSVNSLNTSVSSRGRRIVPVLSYWTGKRKRENENERVCIYKR